MAGILDPKTGLLTQAPEGTTINETGIVNRPITSPTQQTQPVQAIPTPNTRSQISETPQAGYIQGYDSNQNYKPVYVPKGVYVPGISPTPKEMTTSSFQNQGTVKVPSIQTPEGQPDAMVAGGKATIESVMQEFSAPATQAQTMQSDFLSNIAGLTKELENKGVDQLSAEQSAGIPQLKTQFADINSQISTKLAEYNALQTQNKNRPVTMSSIIGSERAILDAKASDIGLLQAQAEGLKGQIQVAQETANRAVDLKYSTIEARLATYESQLRAIEPILSKEEKQQAQAQQILLDRQKQEIADKKEKEKAIQDTMLSYIKAGGTNANIMQQISSSSSYENALQILAENAPPQTEIVDLGNRKVLINSITGKAIKDLGAVGKVGGTGGTGIGGTGKLSNLTQAIIDNPSLFDNLTNTQKGNIISELQLNGYDTANLGTKPLSDSAIKEISQTQKALDDLANLKTLIQGNESQVGPLKGWAAINPYSPAKKLQADINRVRQTVGKALEGGVLRKEDEEKYKEILAKITDTPETAIYKIDALVSSITQDISTYKALQQSGGRSSDVNAPLTKKVTGSLTSEESRKKYNY